VKYRPDIEGLRAVCIALVVAYHYFPSLLRGGYIGVDVFFVISGYLITRSLVGQWPAHGGLADWLISFWARRARRLLPNALLVLTAVSLVGAFLLSDFAIKKLGSDVFASATYAANWLFILRSVDYLQWDDARNSILLNYWSLAVEEQFYLLWPFVVYWILRQPASARPLRWISHSRPVVVGLLFAASLSYAIWQASTQMTVAFLSSPARMWELIAGASLALGPAGRRLPLLAAICKLPLASIGIAAIAASGALFSDETLHPGWLTLLPVAGAMAVIASDVDHRSSLISRCLASWPMQYIGSRSYSIYLWHWPVLILGKQWLPPGVGWVPILLLGTTLLVAEAAYRYVEQPFRYRVARSWSYRRVAFSALAASVTVAALGLGLRAVGVNSVREMIGLSNRSMEAQGVATGLSRLGSDLPVIYRDGCHLPLEARDIVECVYGDAAGSTSAVLFGDSHAAQWFPALEQSARAQGVRLYSWTKSGCPSADVTIWNDVAKGIYAQCDAWRERVFERIGQSRPKVVILSNLFEGSTVVTNRRTGTKLRGREGASAYREGLTRSIRRLQAAGATVVIIRDTPRPRPDLLECMHSAVTLGACDLTRAEAANQSDLDDSAARDTGATLWDFTDAICPGDRCPVAIGQPPMFVYRDSNHLTASFVRALAPQVTSKWRTLPSDEPANEARKR
jgi:peptidoglycan/LPS O-acetylase OafA/YrhL